MSRPTASESIERVDASGHGFFVRCDWRDDRFQHTIGIISCGQRQPILASTEGLAEDDWPSSPPLQQVLSQTVDGDPALLGIGMANGCHWSASFVLHGPKSIRLVIETACLVSSVSAGDLGDGRISRLRTRYTILEPHRPGDFSSTDDPHVTLTFPSLPQSESETLRLSGDRIMAAQDRLSVAAKETMRGQAIRWALRIEAIS